MKLSNKKWALLLTMLVCVFIQQNSNAQRLPKRYYSYKYATEKPEQIKAFNDALLESGMITKEKHQIINNIIDPFNSDGQKVSEPLRCYMDVLNEMDDVAIFYNSERLPHYKNDFISKVNELRKLPALNQLDSVWFEYFRDTLYPVENVIQYSGFALCMKGDDQIIKERIYIPISNSGQFYKTHYLREYRSCIQKAINTFLAATRSEMRLEVYSNPLFFHPKTHKMLDQDGVAFLFINEEQFKYFTKEDRKNYFKSYKEALRFKDYNTHGQKSKDIEAIVEANLMWYYKEPTKRSIVRRMRSSSYNDLDDMLHKAYVNRTHIMRQWGVYPDVYSSHIKDLADHTRGRLKLTIIKDEYKSCNGINDSDSFEFTVSVGDTLISGRFHCMKYFDWKFANLMHDVAKIGFPERTFYLASCGKSNYFYVFLTEEEKNTILINKLFYLYSMKS
jgi:hypothetical protein